MNDDVRLLAQIGAGPDGVTFRARRGDEPVEVRTLSGARADAARWPALRRRLQLAALVDHPAARRVLALELDADRPRVLLEPAAGTPLHKKAEGHLPFPALEALPIALDLAAALRAAHRTGLAHGAVGPEAVLIAEAPRVKLDLTGTDTGAAGAGALAGTPRPEDDVAALARLVTQLVTQVPSMADTGVEGEVPPLFVQALRGAQGPPDERPSMAELEDRLRLAMQTALEQAGLAATNAALDASAGDGHAADAPPRSRLGRFRLLEKLGQGGMGEVYKAEDLADGRIVAVKTLLPELSRRPEMLRRFQKEARLLGEVNNPFVTNLLEVNEDDGVHFLAVEFVAGTSVGRRLSEGPPFDERQALAVLADVCRALVDAHTRGIVHRDIKPDNILLPAHDGAPANSAELRPIAKLSDFGLARHVIESQSLELTRTGAILGTPLYLAPEQCVGAAVGPPSDVYSAGATLFHLLAGRPPFVGDSPLALINQHTHVPPPALRSLNPAVSEATCRIVEKALAKAPAHRQADAGELLADIERVLRGEPAKAEAHPRLPEGDPKRVVHYDWTWELAATPEQLWPHVSNTERLNRAINLPAPEFTTAADGKGRVRRRGAIRKFGLEAAWEEHPFEWVEGRRFGVVRECSSGPFRWLVSIVELAPRPGGGTALTHRFRILPGGLLGRTFTSVEVGLKTRRALDRVYRRIDAVVRGQGGKLADPFEDAPRLAKAQSRQLEAALDRLAGHGLPVAVVEGLGAWLAAAPPQEVARIRPLALARRLGLPPEEVTAACLHGAREGLFVLLWDLICPLCRIPSQIHETLRALKEHGHCPACQIDYAVDFARSVELIFRAHPSVRDSELGVYCIGGPAHSPHVVAQVRLAAGERARLELALGEGTYQVRGRQLPGVVDVRVMPGVGTSRLDVDLGQLAPGASAALRPGGQVVEIHNPHDQELVVRLERAADREDALTAARAAALALFRELFPGEVLSPGQLVSVATVTLLQTDVPAAGALADRGEEAKAFGLVHEHLRRLEALARRHGGALVKAVSAGGLAAFQEPAAAVRAAAELEEGAKLAIHRGPAMAATINDHLDYFGATVRQAAALLAEARPGEWLLGQSVMDDPAAARLVEEAGRVGQMHPSELPGGAVHRFARRGP